MIIPVMLDVSRDTGFWDVILWKYDVKAGKDPTLLPLRISTMPAYSYGVDFERLIPTLLSC